MTSRMVRMMKAALARIIWNWQVRRTAASVGPGLRVNHRSIVTPTTHIGQNVHLNGLHVQGCGTVTIGNNFHSGPDCLFITQNHNYDAGNALPYDETYLARDIVIGDNVWLGTRVIVLGGVEIGEGVVVQAGSCVVKSLPKCAVAGGHPATVFKFRDQQHYNALKALGRFH